MSTSTKVTVRRVSAHAVQAEKIVVALTAMTGARPPGFVHIENPRAPYGAKYAGPGHYSNYPQGVIVLARTDVTGLEERIVHEYQHHLDRLAGIRALHAHSEHDEAFYERLAALLGRYRAYQSTAMEGRSS